MRLCGLDFRAEISISLFSQTELRTQTWRPPRANEAVSRRHGQHSPPLDTSEEHRWGNSDSSGSGAAGYGGEAAPSSVAPAAFAAIDALPTTIGRDAMPLLG